MATTLKLRRGTTAAHSTFTGAAGEVTVDTDKDVVVVHDGTTAGGFPAVRAGGTVTASAGTVSAPAITTTGDTNTGIFFPAADTIAFSENGVESMRIDSSGRLGIGTVSPTELLQVNAGAGATARAIVGGGSTAVLVINGDRDNSGDTNTEDASLLFNVDGSYSNSLNSGLGSNGFRLGLLNGSGTSALTFVSVAGNADSEVMRIDSTGKLGLGTNAPTESLQVSKNQAAGTGILVENGLTNAAAYSSVSVGADGGNAILNVNSSLGSTSALLGGGNGAGLYTTSGLSGGLSVGTFAGPLKFFAGSSTAEHMRIDSSGNVGIGTSSPQELLELSASNNGITAGTAPNNTLRFNDADVSTASGQPIGRLEFYGNDTGNENVVAYIDARAAGTSGGGFFVFGTSASAGGAATDAFTMSVTGGIGISRTAVTSPVSNDGNVFSGTYTPSLSNTTNITSSTAFTSQYMRVGNVVTVSGRVTIDPTATGSITLGVSLPIASTFTAQQQCCGVSSSQQNDPLGIVADATNLRASFIGVVNDAASRTYSYSFTYQII